MNCCCFHECADEVPPSTDEKHMNKNEEIQRSDSYKCYYVEPDIKEVTDSEGTHVMLSFAHTCIL